MHQKVELFVSEGCTLCPSMQAVFSRLFELGEISALEVFDISEQSALAQRYSIRSVPFYRIGELSYSGVRSEQEIRALLQQNEQARLTEWMTAQLREGELTSVENKVLQSMMARAVLVDLLESEDTELVVRIGLSAVIETLAPQRFFDSFVDRFILLSEHPEPRIAIDALYYLQLISTPQTLQQLDKLAKQPDSEIAIQAQELLLEAGAESVAH